MKKILALVIAVAMLASMTVGATAAVTGGQGVITFGGFIGGGTDNLPAHGIHNPLPITEAPANNNWPANPIVSAGGVLPPTPTQDIRLMQDWDITWGPNVAMPAISPTPGLADRRTFLSRGPETTPPGQGPISPLYTVDGTQMGIAVQSANTNPPGGANVTPRQQLNLGIGAFRTAPDVYTLNGFTIHLDHNANRGFEIQGTSGPVRVGHSIIGVAEPGIGQGASWGASGTRQRVAHFQPGLHGFQWDVNLIGTVTTTNIPGGQTATAQFFWELTTYIP